MLDSFDKYEDAVAYDAKANSKDYWVYTVKEGDLVNHLDKSLDGESFIYKP